MDIHRPQTLVNGQQTGYDRCEMSGISRGSSSMVGGDVNRETRRDKDTRDECLVATTETDAQRGGLLLPCPNEEDEDEVNVRIQRAVVLKRSGVEGMETTEMGMEDGDGMASVLVGDVVADGKMIAAKAVQRDMGAGATVLESVEK